MPDEKANNFRDWLKRAGEDELSINAILKEEAGAPSTACFLSQQMAEKLLKGLLVYHDQEFPKIHDLLALETMIIRIEPRVVGIHEDLRLLNRYYVETRYPGDYPECNFAECKEAFKSALRIKDLVLEWVGL